jgi:hypothetical protein
VNRRALRKLRESIPKPDPGGIYLFDHTTGREHFMPYDHLHRLAQDLMDPANAQVVAEALGKMHYKNDPTYNLRKKR